MTYDSSIGVIALVPDAWDGIVMPRHQVLGRLAQHFAVVWVDPQTGWRDYYFPSGSNFLRTDRWASPSEGLDVFTPGLRHPRVFRPSWLRALSLRSLFSTVRRRLIERGATRIVLYIWRDEFADALDFVEHDISCYHLDDEYSFDERDLPNSPREVRLLNRVNQVIVHSPALEVKKGRINSHTARVPNGVDYEVYSTLQAEPSDLAAIPHPRIGYGGVIKKQLDLGLVIRLARARPTYSFVFVGPEMNLSGKEPLICELKVLPNVYFLGVKAPASLPGYIQHFDVCLMCYDVNNYTKYIYPLKLHEYLATGRPTVSSPIDAVTSFASVVELACSDEDWLSAIERCLLPNATTSSAKEARQRLAHKHDWNTLVNQIAVLFRQALERVNQSSYSPETAPLNLSGK